MNCHDNSIILTIISELIIIYLNNFVACWWIKLILRSKNKEINIIEFIFMESICIRLFVYCTLYIYYSDGKIDYIVKG